MVINPNNPFTQRELKAIPTWYAGCKFRSRLEARWAVFFDTIGTDWQYEPESYDTPYGWYIPDFYLPVHGAWVEVKGGSFSQKDQNKAGYVAEKKWCEKGDKFRVLVGDIPRPQARIIFPLPPTFPRVAAIPSIAWVIQNPEFPTSGGREVSWKQTLDMVRGWSAVPWIPAYRDETHFDEALTAARSARFEHGQSGASK